MPQNKQMKIQWITVNGRQVPLVLPQTYNYDKDDWVITSDKDPLPIVEYGTTEGGVIIPKRVSDDGAADVRLTGSIPEYGWLHSDDEPSPSENFAMGIRIEADSSLTVLYWDGNKWGEIK